MPRRRELAGILDNFLSTFTSRYADIDGYWAFGLLVAELDRLDVDLLAPAREKPHASATEAVAALAAGRFSEQLAKSALDPTRVREARLSIARAPEVITGNVNGQRVAGHEVTFVARAVTDLGRAYTGERRLFVAPHDPAVERRSGRAAV